jgi:hypothetical protein
VSTSLAETKTKRYNIRKDEDWSNSTILKIYLMEEWKKKMSNYIVHVCPELAR